ncbi:MAG: Trm112 family protein [Planctomyces sp.]|jgi:uncharacterized protein YbaR (Trm112 family)
MQFPLETILKMLVCPKSRRPLVIDEQSFVSTCPETRMRYPITDHIPRLLVEEAEQLTPAAWSVIMTRHGRDSKTGK